MERAIELVEAGFLHEARRQALNQPRRRLQLADSATLHYMAAVDTAAGYLGAKIYSTHPKTGAHFVVLLYASDGRPLATIEANALGQIRTGAATAVATRRLARPDAAVVGMVGSGFQARTQLEAVTKVRAIREARVFSRSAENCRRFADEMSRALGISVTPADSAAAAIQRCDIVITATTARQPVLLGEWLAPGAHLNAAGSNQARRRELDAAAVDRASLVVVDSIEQARVECGDLIAAFDGRPEAWDRVLQLSELLAQEAPPGRQTAGDITLFESQGVALEDIAVAGYLYEQAVGERP